MKKVIHFKSTKERLDFLRGKHEEIVPVEVKPVEVEEEKPKKKSQSKGKKKDGKLQAKSSGKSADNDK